MPARKKKIKQSCFFLLLPSLQISLLPMTAHEIKPLWPHWRKGTHLAVLGTHTLTVPLGKQEMSRSWRRASPTWVQGARSILPRPAQQCDCSGRVSRQTAFTGTSPASGCKGSQISDLSSIPSSPEWNYLQEISQASRSTTSPQTSPTAALTLSGLWQLIPFMMVSLVQCSALRYWFSSQKERYCEGERNRNMNICLYESSQLLWVSWSCRHLQKEAHHTCSLWACIPRYCP